MGTKTLTIMEDVYELLVKNKRDEESFSGELRRLFSERKKRDLRELFGIISENEGELILKDLEMIRERNTALLKEQIDKGLL